MTKAALLLLLLTPADYTVCTPVPTGPIVSQKPVQPFGRKPDEAMTTLGYGSTNNDDWPPERFQKIGSVWVVFAQDQADLDRQCGPASKGFIRLACSQAGRIVLPNPHTFSGDYRKVVAHELGHYFGGWPGDHPR